MQRTATRIRLAFTVACVAVTIASGLSALAAGEAVGVGRPVATSPATPPSQSDVPEHVLHALRERRLAIPVAGVARSALRDNYEERRDRTRSHAAIDIAAERGTPVIAVDDGSIAKLFRSVPGGTTIYQFDPDRRFVYYYAHLDRYEAGLREAAPVRRGEVIGYVGTTGNAAPDAPHLHFAIHVLDDSRAWWKGTPVNPFPFLVERVR